MSRPPPSRSQCKLRALSHLLATYPGLPNIDSYFFRLITSGPHIVSFDRVVIKYMVDLPHCSDLWARFGVLLSRQILSLRVSFCAGNRTFSSLQIPQVEYPEAAM